MSKKGVETIDSSETPIEKETLLCTSTQRSVLRLGGGPANLGLMQGLSDPRLQFGVRWLPKQRIVKTHDPLKIHRQKLNIAVPCP